MQPPKVPTRVKPRTKPKRILAFAALGILATLTIWSAIKGNTPNSPTEPPPTTAPSTFTPRPSLTQTKTLFPTLDFTATSIFTPTFTFTPTLTLPAAAGASCVPDTTERVTAQVVKITDGDTIHVMIDGKEYRLRYIGMDTPETGAPGGSTATAQNRSLVEGKTVTLVKDVSETDSSGRLLRYVFVGDVFVNYQLVRDGFAIGGSWPPDTACDQIFADAQSVARANQLGMWVPTATVKPYIVPLAVIPTKNPVPTMAGNCSPAYPDFCIPPPPPDLDCKDVAPHKRFKVLSPDPHKFDQDGDGVGCES